MQIDVEVIFTSDAILQQLVRDRVAVISRARRIVDAAISEHYRSERRAAEWIDYGGEA